MALFMGLILEIFWWRPLMFSLWMAVSESGRVWG